VGAAAAFHVTRRFTQPDLVARMTSTTSKVDLKASQW
jgi:hypothetical protein